MNKKILYGMILPLLAITLVLAIANYYGFLTFNVNTNQPISINGNPISEEPIILSDFSCDANETCLGEIIKVANSDDEDKLVVVSANSSLDVDFVGKLKLTKKDSSWTPIGDKIEIIYTLVGNTFEFSGVPEGYTLIYYKDEVVGLEGRLENPQPAIIVTSDIGNLPTNNDANIDELANYCQYPDNYEHCKGAKLWIVDTNDLTNGDLNWANMFDGYYYETDLIYYFANANGEIIIPANSFIEFYPQVYVDKYTPGESEPVEITIK